MLLMLVIFIALAALAPLFGADSRDGLDWTPNHFWLRRGSRPEPEELTELRRTDSRGPASEGRGAADSCRTAPAAG
jgi:hypothetical protein